jgi:hypothetical protein
MENILLQSNPPSIEFPAGSNIFIGFIKWNVFQKNMKLPDIQREIDKEWVEKLYHNFLLGYKQQKYYNFDRFHLCCLNNELYLLNGQHRYQVLKKINDDTIEIEFKIESVKSKQEMDELFMKYNHSKPSKILQNTSSQLIVNALRKYFDTKYGIYISHSNKPRRPQINLDLIVEYMDENNVIDKLKIKNPQMLINMIEELNNYYRSLKYDYKQWKDWDVNNIEKIMEKIHKKSAVNPLYLGIYNKNEWILKLLKKNIDNKDYTTYPHYNIEYKRKKIRNTLRSRVWRKRNKEMDGKCFVCECQLSNENFVCGHVKAVFWGGTNDLDNLEPICSSCNTDMSVNNLYEYKSINY